jgi:hypothetical protein
VLTLCIAELLCTRTGENWVGPAPLDEHLEALHTTAYLQYTSATAAAQKNTVEVITPSGAPGVGAQAGASVTRSAVVDPIKKPAEDPNVGEELRLLEHPSIYFIRNKFPPIFLESERKAIFEIVLPEMYVTDFAASVKDTESHMLATQERLRAMEKQMQLQTQLLQRLLPQHHKPSMY